MSLKHEYPLKFNLSEVVEESISEDRALWEHHRGFIPKEPYTYEGSLVISLYSTDGRPLSKQLRDVHDKCVDTKYSLTKNIYDSVVRTTPEEIPGVMVICEGTIDCLLLRTLGVNAYTVLGLKHFRVKRAFEEIEEKFIFIFDNDVLGRQFAKKYGKYAMEYRIPSHFKDVNDMYSHDKSSFTLWFNTLLKLVRYKK